MGLWAWEGLPPKHVGCGTSMENAPIDFINSDLNEVRLCVVASLIVFETRQFFALAMHHRGNFPTVCYG